MVEALLINPRRVEQDLFATWQDFSQFSLGENGETFPRRRFFSLFFYIFRPTRLFNESTTARSLERKKTISLKYTRPGAGIFCVFVTSYISCFGTRLSGTAWHARRLRVRRSLSDRLTRKPLLDSVEHGRRTAQTVHDVNVDSENRSERGQSEDGRVESYGNERIGIDRESASSLLRVTLDRNKFIHRWIKIISSMCNSKFLRYNCQLYLVNFVEHKTE